jgi:hypothetical protein
LKFFVARRGRREDAENAEKFFLRFLRLLGCFAGDETECNGNERGNSNGSLMLNKLGAVEESDTTEANSSNAAEYIKNYFPALAFIQYTRISFLFTEYPDYP